MPEKNLHGYGTIIKNYRNGAGMSQADLADALSVKRATIVNWELERTQPDIRYLQALCNELNIPPAELLGVGSLSSVKTYTEREKALIALFRELSWEGKDLAEEQLFCIKKIETNRRCKKMKTLYFPIDRYGYDRPAAGTGNPFSEMPPEIQLVKHTAANYRADAIMTVDGRSMEPMFHSGDLIYVRYTNAADPGDIVVCSTADGAVIKCLDSNRRLYSLNKDMPYGMKNEDDHVCIQGRVLGIVQPGDLPKEEELAELEEILAPEIEEYKRSHFAADWNS